MRIFLRWMTDSMIFYHCI